MFKINCKNCGGEFFWEDDSEDEELEEKFKFCPCCASKKIKIQEDEEF